MALELNTFTNLEASRQVTWSAFCSGGCLLLKLKDTLLLPKLRVKGSIYIPLTQLVLFSAEVQILFVRT